VADRRGRNISSVDTARQELEFVFCALPDGHVRALEHLPRRRREHRLRLSARVFRVITGARNVDRGGVQRPMRGDSESSSGELLRGETRGTSVDVRWCLGGGVID
jgi:hypothetical protein